MENSNDNISSKLQETRRDYFGSKYSEHVHGKYGGKVTDTSRVGGDEEEMAIKQFWKEVELNESYKKKMTFGKINY
jgi:hypothetical protein